jgi:hypothetical protein
MNTAGDRIGRESVLLVRAVALGTLLTVAA